MSLYEFLGLVNYVLIGGSLAFAGAMLVRGKLGEKSLRLGPTRDLHQPNGLYVAAVAAIGVYSLLKLVVNRDTPMTILLVVEVIPYAIIGLLLGRARLADAGFRKIGLLPRWPKRDLGLGLLGGVVGLGLASGVGTLVNYLSELMKQPVDPVAHEMLKMLREEYSVSLLVNLIISAVILAPLVEEIVFRGVFQTSLLRLFNGRRWPTILIASAVFAVIHWAVVPWQGLIPLFTLGVIWGVLYERTGSLLPPILAHAVFNAANIALALSLPPQ